MDSEDEQSDCMGVGVTAKEGLYRCVKSIYIVMIEFVLAGLS